MTTPREPCWISVPGGICLYGDAGRPRPIPDLLVARTALTCAPARAAAVPVTGIDHAQASDLAASVGGRLPTSAEWEWIAAGAARRMYPWGDQPWTPSRAVLAGCGCNPRGPGPAGGRGPNAVTAPATNRSAGRFPDGADTVIRVSSRSWLVPGMNEDVDYGFRCAGN